MTKRKRDRDPQPTIQRSPKATVPRHRVYHSGRQVTVYDAVANRASYEGFVKSTLRKNAFGERHRRSQTAYPADEVLGRRKHAPEEPIPFGGGERTTGLPDSDLLIAVHQYASDFYAANGMGPVSYRTLDETALLAVGMLLEETARSCLGDNGDLVFIEPEDESEEEKAEERLQKKPPRKKSKNGKGVGRAEKEHGDGEDE